jgi:hypothetical protein
LTQVAGGLQLESAVHEARHAVASQRYGKQSARAGVTHVPEPLQVDNPVNWSVVVGQLADRHGVPEA